jgi:Transposase DNA-binding
MRQRRIRSGECLDSSESRPDEWIDHEVMGCDFQDVRHSKRMRQLLEQLAGKVGATTPWACQDWANTKAAYRFFSNERVTEASILAGHFASTRNRFSATSGFPVLVLHDTIEFSFTREHVASIGMLKKLTGGYAGKYHTSTTVL